MMIYLQNKEIFTRSIHRFIKTKNKFEPEDMADGGRVGLKGGADAATESFTKSSGSSAKGRSDVSKW